jgi:hypothetical protein
MTKKTIVNNRRLSGAWELLPKSYQIVKDNLSIFAILYLVPAFFAISSTVDRFDDEQESQNVTDLLSNAFLGSDTESTLIKGLGGLVILLSLAYLVATMLSVILVVRAAQGKRPTLGSLWKELTTAFLWLKLIGLVVVLGLTLAAGFILFLIPGVYLLWRLFLAPYILVDKNISIGESISQSWQMTKGFAWPIYSIIIVSIALALTAILPFIGDLVSFLLVVIYSVAPALRYEEIKKTKN